MSVPKEVIVVEGRDDTKRLIETFGNTIKTVETNGSAINRKILQQLKTYAEQFGIIIFTDPDFQGERIRRIVSEAIPSAKHAFLKPEEASSHKIGASLGIEHATPDAIRQALSNVATPLESSAPLIPLAQLVELHLIGHPQAAANRDYVARYFRLGHLNGKQLQKKLATYGISYAQLVEALKEKDNDTSI